MSSICLTFSQQSTGAQMTSGKPVPNLCGTFKTRLTILGPKVKGLPDNHSSKPECLFDEVWDGVECKRLLTYALGLWRERGSDPMVAQVLRFLSGVNRQMGFYQEAREAVGIDERFGDTAMQAECLNKLVFLLHSDKQFDAAEEAVSRAIDLSTETSNRYRLCEPHRSKGDTEKAFSHCERALEIARLLSTGTTKCFGSTMRSRSCLAIKGNSKMGMLTSNTPGRTR